MNITRLSTDILFVYFEENLDCFITDQIDLHASNKSNVARLVPCFLHHLQLSGYTRCCVLRKHHQCYDNSTEYIVYDMYMYRLYIQ